MAETRTIRTVLELNAQRFTQGAAQASASAKGLASELGKISDATGKQKANYDRVANTLLGIGTAAAAGLGMAAKASMDWESAWAGVLKTVDGTPEQLGRVEEGLRGLTKELPASHTEIAAVAEAAGQLGVQTDSVVEFTRTMINLGETTNLSAEEAATGLARFSNVMGTSQDDVDRLGAAIVGLGNNFETTEGEILAMSMRLSGIGSQLGMSEGEVLGLATAMSSVGIEAEAGGTAMTLGMKKIDKAVREGGDSLAGFAEVAGMSNEEFSKLWSEDVTGGLEAVIHGLSRVGEEGGSVSGTLDELGIKGIRESDTFLRLAANAEGASEAIAQGNTEFERNLALVEEAAKRYETTESQLQIARNAIVDASIDIGAQVLPVLAEVAGAVADVAGWFAALPEPVQRSVAGLGAIVATTGLVAGGLMKLVPFASQTVNAFRDLRTTSPQTASALGKVAGFAGRAAGAFAALQIAGMVVDQFREAETGAEGISAGLLNLAETGEITKASLDELFAATGTGNAEVRDLSHALEILDAGPAAQTFDFLASGLGVFDTQTEVATRRLGELDQAFGALYTSGNMEALADALEQSGVPVEELIENLPILNAELTKTATEMGLEADVATLAKIATGELVPVVDDATGAVTGYNTAQGDAEAATDDATGAVQEQIDALQELEDQLQETADLLLGMRGSERDFEAAIDDATAAVKENGKTLDISTEAGRANEAALDGVADATFRWIDSMPDNATAEELDGILARGRESFLETADAMDMPIEQAEELADQLGLIPQFVETELAVETEAAEQSLSALNAAIDDAGGTVTINGDTMDAETALDYLMGTVEESDGEITINGQTIPAEEAVDALIVALGETDGVVTIDADTGPARHMFDGLVSDYPPDADVIVDADTFYAEEQLRKFQGAVNEAGGTVEINGDTMYADEAFATLIDEINAGEGVVNINGIPTDAETALLQLVSHINGSEGVVTIEGNNDPAFHKTDSAKRHADGTTGTIDVDANTAGANSSINNAARDRTSTIHVKVKSDGSVNGVQYGMGYNSYGRADGGWIGPGLSEGGWVPGPYPGQGIDNVLWPVQTGAAGGRSLAMQPLAGTEYVVNGQSAQQWGPALEAINSGISPAQMAALVGGGQPTPGLALTQNLYGPDARVLAAESEARFDHRARAMTAGYHR